MAEILHDAPQAAPRLLGGPPPALDAATRQLFDAAVADAERRGHAEGYTAGRQAAADAVTRAARAVTQRLDVWSREMAEHRAAVTAVSLELAERAAAAVLDRTPPAAAHELLERAGRAVEHLDDDTLYVALNPEDVAALGDAADGTRLEVTADPGVTPGEAVIRGRHATLELTRGALLDAAMDVLAGLDAPETT